MAPQMACGRPSSTCMAQVVSVVPPDVPGQFGLSMPGRLVGEVSVGIDLSGGGTGHHLCDSSPLERMPS